MKSGRLFGICIAVGLAFSPIVHSVQANMQAQVLQTLVAANDMWGGCMARLSVDPQTVLPTCAKNWVTFSCSGDHASKDIAFRMLDTAQLAQVTAMTVFVIITDDMKHNGYCFARRIDVY